MSNVTFDVIARDRASATFRKVGVETESLHSKLKTLIAGAGLATLGYEAVQFGKKAVQAFADAQTAQTKLADAFKRFPALTDVTIASLRELNDALQAKTGADHNALASGEAVLAGFKLTGDQIRQLIPIVDDYAAKTGQDIPTAATSLGRAFLGNTRALKTIGIDFKATGNTAQDFASIMGLLQAKVGGFATREGKTAAGQLKILQAEFHDVEEQIGSALLPALLDLGHFLLHDVIPPLKATSTFIKDNKNVIEPLAKAIGLAVLAWKSYVIWTKAAAVANVLFGRSAAAAAAGAGAAGGAGAIGAAGAGGFGILAAGRALTLAPAAGVGTQSDMRLPAANPAGQALYTQALKILHSLHGAPLAQAQKFSKDVLLPSGFSVKALQQFVARFGSATTAEHHLDSAVKTTTASLHKQYKALTDHQAKALALSQGMDDLRSAVRNMAVTVGGGSRALKGNSDAAIANRDALRGAVSQAESYLTTLKQHGASAQHVARVQRELSKAIRHNADETYGDKNAVRDLLQQLTFLPEVLHNVKTAFDKATDAQNVYATHAEQLAQRGLFGPAAKKKAKDAGGDLGGAVSGGYSDVVDKGVADASKKAADAAKAAFDKAKSKMEADFSTIKSYFAQQRETIISGFANFDTSGRSDLLGASGPPTPFLQQLNAQAKEADKFTRLWIRLDNEGLNPRLLDMFESLGPAAIPTMQLWASHSKMRHRANRDIRRIGRDATRIGAAATEDKYGPLIHRDLVTLPKKIGDEFRHKVQVTLDTKSLDRLEGRRVQMS